MHLVDFFVRSFLNVGQGLYYLLSILLIFSSTQIVMNEFNLPDKELSLNLKVLDLSFFT